MITYLNVGKNKLNYVYVMRVQWLWCHSWYWTNCSLDNRTWTFIQVKNVSSWDEKSGLIVIEHKTTNPLDILQSFNIYFSQRNDWHGIVTENWAFGNFVGYSFLDFFNRCVDIIFHYVYKLLKKRRLALSNQVFPETEHLA